MKISNFAIRRPVFTLVSMFLVIILGLVSLLNIPLKLIPEINPPIGVVVVNYPGAGPTEVVEKVTKPIEESLSTLPGLTTMSSTSQENSSLTLMQFSWTTSIEDVESEVQSRIDSTTIAEDANKPRFMKFDPSQFPVIQLSLSTNTDSATLQELAENLVTELNKVNGVASVSLGGTIVEEIKVVLDEEVLKQYTLTQQDIVDILRANSISLPGNTVETEGKELTTRVISTVNSVENLQQINITKNPANGETVTLADVADVSLAPQEENTITRANQEPALLVSVLQQSDANTAEVSESFRTELDDLLSQEKYEEIESDVLFDQGDFIQIAIGNMSNTLILGGLFAMLVLFFFLRSVKSPLIIGIAIPYSVIVTFVLMYFSDFTLNILTLGGLALGIGMLVDNAIVVIENIYRHLSMGKEPKEAAEDGTKEVGTAIVASTLTTVAVFLPVVFISGIIGQLFTEFAFTIAFSLFASLFVALTVVPMLASKFLKTPRENIEVKRQESSFMKSLEGLTKWSLRNRALVLVLTIIITAGSIFGLTTVGTEFLPSSDEGFFTVGVELENGATLSETEKTVKAIEEVLSDETEVDVYVSSIGSTQDGAYSGTGSANEAEIYVKMKELDNRTASTFDFMDEHKREIESAARSANSTAEVSLNVQSSSGSSPNTLTFNVKDNNINQLNEAVERITVALRDLEDITEVSTDLTETIEEVQITVDRDKAFEQGLLPIQIATTVNDVTRGTTAIQLTDENQSIYPVNVGYDRELTSNIDQLSNLLIKKPDNSYIELSQLTDIQIGEGPTTINRIDQQSAVQFTVKFATTTNLGDISSKVDAEIADLDLSDETEITFGGDRELLESSMDDLGLAFVLALVFIYLVMAAQFESFKHPFVIMFTVPLMIIGVAIALTATRTPIGLTAFIGIIVLAGIVVNNAIVLIDYINQKKEAGMKTYDAIVDAVKERTRPILMTATTTILGLLPLAIGLGEGSEMNQPMGISVIGGLISSTFLTLFIIPIVYSLFDKETRRLNKKYVTPDGQLIPAYLIEERFEKAVEKEETESSLPVSQGQQYKKQDMVHMLEELLKIVKDEDKDKGNKE
ncbi:efflux RND transporter permease subunit [Litchfieldia salsa]|uniref:Hydrophobic/amphiphilic exporter-1, HAE1 family n=1 Tax=Litchfieldia salsa TaxID=930152 RepID=A0A1H0S0J6_9BACI|nr:efflux RND transporter permease subunit [Litchfieldia salsa]SDP35244.1 hydrophobic/amphiphilic exporter-1, HAE1 family [Litchfieldia salsa]